MSTHPGGRSPGRGTLARRRAVTLVELVVVMVLIGLLMAVSLPKLLESDDVGEGHKATTTASGALNTATRLYADAGVHDGAGCNPSQAAPREQMDPGPYIVADRLDDAAAASGAVTSCPVFANPINLLEANGDLKFVSGQTISPANSTASVAAVDTTDGWRLAVAVASGTDEAVTCWAAWHQFPSDEFDGGGQSLERYFTFPGSEDSPCSGNFALTMPATCPAGDGSSPAGGTTWGRACQVEDHAEP